MEAFNVVIFLLSFIIIMQLYFVIGETPKFRILAPEFVCPKDKDTPVDKPDNTIITLQTAAGSDFDIVWSVRWTALEAPSQRFTLLLWKTVRELEKRLNRAQPEPFVYVIPNDELLHGVNYIFHLTSVEPDGTVGSPKSFHIDNTQGDQKLDMVEGRSELLFVVLAGAQITYVDTEYVLQALMTSCFPTQDFHYLWTVQTTDTHEIVYVSPINGSRLVVPPYTLKAGREYDVNCQVIKHSTGHPITQTGLPFQVLFRGLEVYLSVDLVTMPHNQPFSIESKVLHRDYYDRPVMFKWECSFESKPCDFQGSLDNDTLYFPAGLSELGEYEIKLSVSVMGQNAEARSIIKTVGQSLPVLQINPISRSVNAGSNITLVANASNVAPTCTLTWFFATEDFLATNKKKNITCEECQQGEPLSDTFTFNSLEENFLTELADFSNETEWRQVTVEMEVAAGRARFVAECGCSVTFECITKGTVYADVGFTLNEIPKPGEVLVSPETGTAMETIFRISTVAVPDKDQPLHYSFYCRVAEDDVLLLGSFVGHLAVETFLPYVDGGVNLWVEVCDSLGACAIGDPTVVVLAKGDGSTLDAVIEGAHGHIRRCDLLELMKDFGSGVITYTNADQPDLLAKLTESVFAALPPDEECLRHQSALYANFLNWLSSHGVA